MSNRSYLRQLAYRLLRHTTSVMPDDHSKWVAAMCTEIEFIENDYAAAWWAIGCLLTGYKTRVRTMLNMSPDYRRKFLRTELLICFIPITLWFISGFVGLVFYLLSPHDTGELMKVFSDIVSAFGSIKTFLVMLSPLIGPFGFILVLLLVLKHKHVSFWWPLFGLVLCLPLADVTLTSVGRAISDDLFFVRWRDMVIFIFPMMLFPIAGFIQLFFLSRKDTEHALPEGMDELSG